MVLLFFLFRDICNMQPCIVMYLLLNDTCLQPIPPTLTLIADSVDVHNTLEVFTRA